MKRKLSKNSFYKRLNVSKEIRKAIQFYNEVKKEIFRKSDISK